jgi:hypothetical protein
MDWASFLAGAQIQLFVYLLALETWRENFGRELRPGLAEYQGIEPRWSGEEADFRPVRVPPKGLDDAALLERLLSETRRIIAELGSSLLAGEISPRPLRYSDGRWPPSIDAAYRAVSRFDPLVDTHSRTMLPGGARILLPAIAAGEDFGGSAGFVVSPPAEEAP